MNKDLWYPNDYTLTVLNDSTGEEVKVTFMEGETKNHLAFKITDQQLNGTRLRLTVFAKVLSQKSQNIAMLNDLLSMVHFMS